jgi:hypothetical protein
MPALASFGETLNRSTLSISSGSGTWMPFVSTSTSSPGSNRSSSTISRCCRRGSPPVTTTLGTRMARMLAATSPTESSFSSTAGSYRFQSHE